MWAARNGHQSVVELLITAGASLDIQTKVGCLLNYLYIAARWKYTDYRVKLVILLVCCTVTPTIPLFACVVLVWRVKASFLAYCRSFRTLHELAMMCMFTPSLFLSLLERLLFSVLVPRATLSSPRMHLLSSHQVIVVAWIDCPNICCSMGSSQHCGFAYPGGGETRYTD